MFKMNRDRSKNLKKANKITFPLLPLRDIVIFPHMVIPLFVGRAKSISALENGLKNDKNIFLSTQKSAKVNDPAEEDIYRIGVIGNVLQLLRLPDGTVKVLVEGRSRGRIVRYLPNAEFFQVEVEEISTSQPVTSEGEALIRTVIKAFETYGRLNKKISTEAIAAVTNITDSDRLSDSIASHLTIKLEDRQLLLETQSPSERLEKLFGLMQSEIEIMEIERKIKARVKKQMEKSQKEYYLNEQMRAIQKEMGEKDELKNEIQEIENSIKNKKMSKEATEKTYHELKKLKMMSPMSAEATVVRNYIDWILSLPWYKYTEDKLDIDQAGQILDEDHYSLKKPKERILEYLAVQSLVEKIKGPILCFVGPPGVGKTSLAKSIARATSRKFIRLSLGGVRDEAEIRGHRRTYIGAMPGKIIQSLKKAGSNNPVFLLDEVDKMSTDFRGDPSSALLEVLDPEQNHTFGDHYLDLDYDLSRVMFITTANTLHSIPPALQDRMEVIRIAGYTEIDKLQIAKGFLISKQLEANGLNGYNVHFSDNAILKSIRRYTREAGVRNLEREIASICRKVAREVIRDKEKIGIKITSRSIPQYLGVPKFRYGITEEKDEIGMATGLAWTEAGGELLTTEVAIMPGKGKLIVTGKLGEVMQESAQAALSYVRSRSRQFGLESDFYMKLDIHIHVPEGAIPKDGPSAGITMATSIASALTKVPVRRDIAMTGEITLRGRILPIGGLKEKVLAAHRGQIKQVIIPYENEKDLGEIPQKIRKDVDIKLAEHMDQVLRLALKQSDSQPSSKGEETDEVLSMEGSEEVAIAH